MYFQRRVCTLQYTLARHPAWFALLGGMASLRRPWMFLGTFHIQSNYATNFFFNFIAFMHNRVIANVLLVEAEKLVGVGECYGECS